MLSAAGVLAFCAWGLLERYMSDMLFLQGPITAINLEDSMDGNFTANGQPMHLKIPGQGWVEVQNQPHLVHRKERAVGEQPKRQPLHAQ